MTVAELIEKLGQMPSEANCVIYAVDSGSWVALVSIRLTVDDDPSSVYLETSFDHSD